jgi:SAM-dependent methyltransferase
MNEKWRDPEARKQLRATFQEVPDLYDRARPTYPDALFDDLEEMAGLRPGSRVLEIGPGTGKATVSLAGRGYRVTGVELGADLAAVARRNVPQAEIVVADFEQWKTEERFDAVVAFSAFHWLDLATAYPRSAALLKPSGVLAVSGARHVLPRDGDPLFREIREDYRRFAPDEKGEPPLPPEEVPDWPDEILASGAFARVEVRRYVWDIVYGAQQYIDLIDTYSGHRVLPPEAKDRLYDAIRVRIEARGSLRKTYLAILHVAFKE